MTRLSNNIRYAICYIRKSREDEEAELRGEDTLLKQRELMLREVLTRYSFDYDIAEEIASGDSIRDRPVFRKLLPELGTKYQAIVCKDLSRLGRGSYGDMGIVYDIIRDRRIFIITKDAIYDPRNFSDLRMIRFSLFFNREEYEMTVWRLTEGKYDGAQRGKWVAGSVPYGFNYDSKLQVLVPNEAQAVIVRSIYQWYTDGLGYNAISTKLRRLGVKTARGNERWHPQVIRRILQNPAYKGTLQFRKTQRNKMDGRVVQRPIDEHIVVENAFESLIDVNVWEQAQSRLGEVQSKKPRVKYDFSPSELASVVTCSRCGKKLVRQFSVQHYRKRDGSISKYEKEFLYCQTCGYSVKYRDCEAQLLHVLGKMSKFQPELLERQLQMLQGHAEQEAKVDMDALQKQFGERKRALENRIMRAREFLLDGTFTKTDFEAARSKYEQDLQELMRDADSVEHEKVRSNQVKKLNVGAIRSQLHSVLETYSVIEDKSAKNRLLLGLFDEVMLTLIQKGTGKKNPTRFDLLVRLHPNLLSLS